MTDVVIHGHFYQPPRENPWTGQIEREPSASPAHDWNERIHAECYRPNAYARVVNPFGQVEQLVNNYAHLSFNVGPTLLNWMSRHDPDAYARILAADAESVRRNGGHGNAIAQVYNHAILPLCNAHDRRTQVRWGVADFHHRFGRAPASIWLAETACNDAVLATLIDEGLAYVVLSPHQAERVRPIGSSDWRSVADGSIDPGVAYRYSHPDGSGRSIALFFYDAPIARALAFEGALASSQAFVHRLTQAQGGPGRLIHVATDGESYGHHTRFGERGLAYAVRVEAPSRGFRLTNYGSFLERHPPTFEVQLKPGPNGEGTAWSCAHGVGRWCRDCGCQTGGREGWNQAWRAPLRHALDHLRDAGVELFTQLGGELFRDPWEARDAYVELLLQPERRGEWLARHQRRPLGEEERVRALTLLELQRNALLMYTSCGWFFTELSGIETVQVLKYAACALDAFDTLGASSPRTGFVERLAQARSNLPEHGTGADVFQRYAEPSRVGARRVAVSLAISSLVGEDAQTGTHGGYAFRRSSFRKETHGRLTMATGRLELTNLATGQHYDYARVSLHLGGVDFYCALRPYVDAGRFRDATEALWSRFSSLSIPEVLRLAHDHFGPEEYGLKSVLEDARHDISELVYGDVVSALAGDYGRVYRQNERIILMLEDAGIDLPQELRAAAELALGHQLDAALRTAARTGATEAWSEVLLLARHAAKRGHRTLRAPTRHLIATLTDQAVAAALEAPGDVTLDRAIELVEVARQLELARTVERAQDRAYAWAERAGWPESIARLAAALHLVPRPAGAGALRSS